MYTEFWDGKALENGSYWYESGKIILKRLSGIYVITEWTGLNWTEVPHVKSNG